MTVEKKQGKGKLRFDNPMSKNSVEVQYRIVITTTMREIRHGFPPRPHAEATVSIEPIDKAVFLDEGVCYLEAEDGESIKLKNLGFIWKMLSER